MQIPFYGVFTIRCCITAGYACGPRIAIASLSSLLRCLTDLPEGGSAPWTKPLLQLNSAPLPLPAPQADGFADDSVRLIKQIRKKNPKVRHPVQGGGAKRPRGCLCVQGTHGDCTRFCRDRSRKGLASGVGIYTVTLSHLP